METGSLVQMVNSGRQGKVVQIRDNGQIVVRLLSGSTVIANKNMFKEVSMEETDNENGIEN